jgi:hypothetical protein
MDDKNRKILSICLEVVGLAIVLPLFYWGSIKLLFVPLIDWAYYPNRKISPLMAFIIVLSFDCFWLVIMKLSLRKKIHLKIILTLVIFTLSAATLTCFVIANALDFS